MLLASLVSSVFRSEADAPASEMENAVASSGVWSTIFTLGSNATAVGGAVADCAASASGDGAYGKGVDVSGGAWSSVSVSERLREYATVALEYDGGMAEVWDAWMKKNGWTDYHLYLMTFWIILGFYIVCCTPYVVLDLLQMRRTDRERLQPGTYNSGRVLAKGALLVLLVFFTTILPLQMCSGPFFEIAGINGTKPFPKLWQALLQIAIFFVIEDYGNYWIHRWLHTPWAYEHIHYMHHEFDTPTALAASYAHPIEVLVLGLPSFIGPAIVGCHVCVCWAWFVLRELEAVETHSGYDFDWSPTKLIPFYGGSEYHDYHHWVGGKSRGNFASSTSYIYPPFQRERERERERRRRRRLHAKLVMCMSRGSAHMRMCCRYTCI